MIVTLPPHLEAMVRRKVETGLYGSESEVIRDALQLMAERDRFQRLRAAVAEGYEQAQRGETVPYSADLMEQLKREVSAAALAGDPIPDDVKP